MAVQLELVGFGLPLVALGGWSFRFPLRHILGIMDLITSQYLSIVSALSIERGSRVAFRARVGKVLGVSILNVVGVEALNVLPGIACFAVYRVPVIVSEAAYTLDSVWLFLNGPNLGARGR